MAILIPGAVARPTSKTPAVRDNALRKILPEVLKWGRQNGDPDEDEERVLEDIGKALNGWNDGYEAARALERYGWSPDAELVSILDCFSTYSTEQEAVKAWVKETEPQPTFKLGDKVFKKVRFGTNIQGEIVKIYPETAQYLVRGEKDVAENQIGTHGTYVNWEDAEQLQ